MRSMTIIFSVLVMLFSQDLFASPKTDSIIAFLGGAHAKCVWTRWAWCNDNYAPKSAAAAKAEGWSLVLMDTRAGTERTLITGLQDPHHVRVSRSGKWATFQEGNTGVTYIVDLTAASPTKRALMIKTTSLTYWAAGTWWIDPANGDEYVFCIDNASFPKLKMVGGNGIYKVKINSDGTVGTANKLTITGLRSGSGGEPPVDAMISVSADGKKLGSAFPWPDTKILDIPTGRLDVRHHTGFGCQANLAPDDSYRFFHCEGDHFGIYMFAADMVNTDWYVNIKTNAPSYSGQANFLEPRWTNHVQYYTCTYPMDGDGNALLNNEWNYMNLESEWNNSLWGWTANQVQTQMPMERVMKFYMGKWSSDFKSQEKSILIASDPRYFQGRGDAWICTGTTYGNQCGGTSASPAFRDSRLQGLSTVQNGAFINIDADGGATVRITDARGRLVRQVTGSGSISVDTRDLAIGAHIVSVHQQGNRLTKQVMIAR